MPGRGGLGAHRVGPQGRQVGQGGPEELPGGEAKRPDARQIASGWR
jgi:hypothetical protein